MPIITPAFPGINSSFNINEYSRTIILNEFRRGYKITGDIINKTKEWKDLIAPSEFFYSYTNFLQIELSTNEKDSLEAWQAYSESK